jgi:PemK-like, MazF-like toxin of type II toxin-antitoxin system
MTRAPRFPRLARLVRRRPTGRPARPIEPSEVAVAYDPHPDGKPDPGEVVWAWIPYEEDPTRGKDRPGVVVGWAGGDVAIVPLTSKHHPGQVPVGRGTWDRFGRASEAKVDRMFAIARNDVRREGATLDRAVFDRIVAALS